MDGNLSTVVQTAKQLSLLAETLERRSGVAVSTQERAALALTRTAASASADVTTLLRASSKEVENATRSAIDRVLTERAASFDKQIATSTNRIEAATQAINVAGDVARSDMARQIRTAYLAVGGAVVLLAVGGGLLIWAEIAAYKDASARSTAAHIKAEVAEAYSQVGMTSCGGHPCVKLDKNAKRWGNKGEYVLLDLPSGAH